MRDYQPVKNNKYQLDPVIYKLVLSVVRSYPAMKKSIENMTYLPAPDLTCVGDGNSVHALDCNKVERKALVLAKKSALCDAVDTALQIVPDVYRQPIVDNIVKGVPYKYCDFASDSTLKRHKSRFLYKLAWELDYI